MERKAAQVGLLLSGQATVVLHMKITYKAQTSHWQMCSDFDEATSFWAKARVLVQCSLAGVWMASLILCQRIQGPGGTWGVFWRAFFPQQQLFWNDADVNNYRAKRSWRGGNRGGLAEFHLRSFGINWHTSKSKDVGFFGSNTRERAPFTSPPQHCNPQTLASLSDPPMKTDSAVSLHMGDCVNQGGKELRTSVENVAGGKFSICGKTRQFE